MWSQDRYSVNQTAAINRSKGKASGVLAYRVRERNKTSQTGKKKREKQEKEKEKKRRN